MLACICRNGTLVWQSKCFVASYSVSCFPFNKLRLDIVICNLVIHIVKIYSEMQFMDGISSFTDKFTQCTILSNYGPRVKNWLEKSFIIISWMQAYKKWFFSDRDLCKMIFCLVQSKISFVSQSRHSQSCKSWEFLWLEGPSTKCSDELFSGLIVGWSSSLGFSVISC